VQALLQQKNHVVLVAGLNKIRNSRGILRKTISIISTVNRQSDSGSIVRPICRVADTVDDVNFPDLWLVGSTLWCGWTMGPTINNTIIAMITSNVTIALAQVALDTLSRAFSKGLHVKLGGCHCTGAAGHLAN
jgi:hypothetical protein